MSYKESKDYSECTPREKKWLESYLTPEDHAYLNIAESTIAAFEISPDNALSYGRSVLARPRIKKLVETELQANSLPTLDEFKMELWLTARDTKDMADKLKALTLFADVAGWRLRTPSKAKTAEDKDTAFDPLNDIQYETPESEAESISNGTEETNKEGN